MKQRKNIGGAILPSSSPEILRPIPFKSGHLQVVPDREADTHRLYYTTKDSKVALASHPNGFSCHCLAERIKAGHYDKEARLKFLEQAEHIILCGGAVDFIAINNSRLPEFKKIGQETKA